MIGIYLTDTLAEVRQPLERWGAPDGDPVVLEHRCRIKRGNRWVRDQQGQQVVSSAQILMRHAPEAGARLRFDGRDHAILAAHQQGDWAGQYWTVYVA